MFSFGLLLHAVCTQQQLFDHEKVEPENIYDTLLDAVASMQEVLRKKHKGAYSYPPVKEVVARTVKVSAHLRATATELLQFEFFSTDKDMEVEAERAQLN
jgi:hypothetical protein